MLVFMYLIVFIHKNIHNEENRKALNRVFSLSQLKHTTAKKIIENKKAFLSFVFCILFFYYSGCFHFVSDIYLYLLLLLVFDRKYYVTLTSQHQYQQKRKKLYSLSKNKKKTLFVKLRSGAIEIMIDYILCIEGGWHCSERY